MSCERFRAALTAYAAGGDVGAAAARHLDGCARCQARVEMQRQLLSELDAELHGSLSVSASPEFVANVTRAARRPVEWRRSWSAPAMWTGIAAAAAIILLAVFVRQSAPVDPARPGDFPLEPPPAQAIAREIPPEPGSPTSAPVARDRASVRSSRPQAEGRPRITAKAKSASADPPVIVEPARAQAILRLRELMIAGRLDGDMLPPPRTPEAVLAELVVAPLGVSEIKVPDVEIVSRPPAAPLERQ